MKKFTCGLLLAVYLVMISTCFASAEYEYNLKVTAAPRLASGKQLNIYNYGSGEDVTVEITSGYSDDVNAVLFLAVYDEENSLVDVTVKDAVITADSVNNVVFSPAACSGNPGSIKVYCIDSSTELNTLMKAYTVGKTYKNIIGGNAVAAAMTESGNANLAAAAIDGNLSTYWCAAVKEWPSWFTVDLGESKSIDRVELLPKAKKAGYTYEILGSNDNTTWHQIAEHLNEKVYVNDELVIADNVTNCTFRYYKVSFTGGNWPALKELRLLIEQNE